MNPKEPASEDSRLRRRRSTQIKQALRQVNNQVALLNHQVSARVELRDVDLDCLDQIVQFGPLSPGALARRTGLHPATMTGIVDRLERGGWVTRERDPNDRRAVRVRALPDRLSELYALFAGMNDAMDEICASYTDKELEVLLDFLRRAAAAGVNATEELTKRADTSDG